MKKSLFLAFVVVFLSFSFSAFGTTIEGVVYHDEDQSSESAYDQSIDAVDSPLPDIAVSLMDGENETPATTNEDGEFTFTDVDPGTYLVDVSMDGYECTSSNHARRTPAAIREGHLNLVCLGDSIGYMMYPPEVPYPDRITAHLSELTDVTLNNIHVPGSRSWEWLPGDEHAYFEDRLLPVIDDADLVTITIGGNDLDIYVEGMSPPYDIWQIVLNFFENPEYALEIPQRIKQLIVAIQDQNPDCDIVMVLYPNFANTTWMQEIVGDVLLPVAVELFKWAIGVERNAMAEDLDGVIIADMMLAMDGLWMDDYLHDEVHPTEAGSQYYADEIFKALGGVVVEEADFGEEKMEGFYAPDLVPADDDTTDDDAVDDDAVDDDAADDDTTDDDAADDDLVDDDVADDDAADDDQVDDDASDDDLVDDDQTDDDQTADDDFVTGDDDDDDDGCGC